MTITEFIQTLNTWGAEKKPFLFMVDFELQKPVAFPLCDINPGEILYDIDGFSNHEKIRSQKDDPVILERHPIAFEDYQKKFDQVHRHLHIGDTYLTNLTVKTEIRLSQSLLDLYHFSKARYKLWYRDQFIVFSPECFVRIANGEILSFPMKGTIDAAIHNATEKILQDKKELAEHVTIVDLIRNDLSLVSRNVAVKRFRFVEELKTKQKNLLQVSSEIAGELPAHYEKNLGDILIKLLPAGSVSGAPKRKTIQIIGETEQENRGYYTGVFGYFNGHQLNSGVMIRYVENLAGRCVYRSGGGITTQSTAELEYQEIINKVYVPVD